MGQHCIPGERVRGDVYKQGNIVCPDGLGDEDVYKRNNIVYFR